jgi:hypothetical protein
LKSSLRFALATIAPVEIVNLIARSLVGVLK